MKTEDLIAEGAQWLTIAEVEARPDAAANYIERIRAALESLSAPSGFGGVDNVSVAPKDPQSLSPVTREALKAIIREYMPGADGEADSGTIADGILAQFSLPEPAEVEYVYWVTLDGDHAEECTSLEKAVNVRDSARGHIAVKDRVIYRQRLAGAWVPVEKGTEQ